MKINVIFTFNKLNQRIVDVNVNPKIYQFEYINYLFSLLDREELGDLVKISNAQIATKSSAIKWLYVESKYFFRKKEDIFWHDYKQMYLQNKAFKDVFLSVHVFTKSAAPNLMVNATKLGTEERFLQHVYNEINKIQKYFNQKALRVAYFKTSIEDYIPWMKKDYIEKKL